MSTEEAPEQAPSPPPTEDSFTIHEKLVAYVHAINSDPVSCFFKYYGGGQNHMILIQYL